MSRKNKRWLIALVVMIAVSTGLVEERGNTQGNSGPQESLPEEELIKRLQEEALESRTAKAYDIVCYEPVHPRNTPDGQFQTWDYHPFRKGAAVQYRPELKFNEPYIMRTQFITRDTRYTPDEIGLLFNRHFLTIAKSGPGNDFEESMRICRKYGIQQAFSVPAMHQVTPLRGFRDSDIAQYRDIYRKKLQEEYAKYLQMEETYGMSILQNQEQIWFFSHSGIIHDTIEDMVNHPERYSKGFRDEIGFELPLTAAADTPEDIARRRLFWRWLRNKCYTVNKMSTEIFRDIFGPFGKTISNLHSEDVVDYEIYGDTYDHPGPGTRPLISDHEIVWKYWTGYSVRLWNDLMDKIPMVSNRVNMMVVDPKVIPTPNTIKTFHTISAQNGVLGFYHFIYDYRPDFSGNAFMNPDKSTLPQKRWDTILEISRTLGTTKRFYPPKAESALLVCIDSGDRTGWQRVFSGYAELAKAKVWVNFISDSELMQEKESLEEYKMVYIPVMDFTREASIRAVDNYVKQGGTAVIGDPLIYSYNMRGESVAHKRESLCGVKVLGEKAGGRVVLKGDYKGITLDAGPYAQNIEVRSGAKIIGSYEDGSPAVVEHAFGKGKVLYFAGGLFDIFHRLKGGDEDSANPRYQLYKMLEAQGGIDDKSWIFDISLDNIGQVTGVLDRQPPPVDESIQLN